MAEPQVQPSTDDQLFKAMVDEAGATVARERAEAGAAKPPVIGGSEAPEGETPEQHDARLRKEGSASANVVTDMMKSAGAGAAKAGFELADTAREAFGWATGGAFGITGEPLQEDKSTFRTWLERNQADRENGSIANGVARNLTQFGIGFFGLGKITKLKAGASAGARFVENTLRGGVVGSTMFDPHEERLSNLMQQYPTLANPITRYLAADPKDSQAEGRFKAAAESVVVDTTLVGALAGVVKGVKLLRAGSKVEAARAFEEAQKGFTDSIAKTEIPEAPPMEQGGPVMSAQRGPGVDLPPQELADSGVLQQSRELMQGKRPEGPVMQAERGATEPVPTAGTSGAPPKIDAPAAPTVAGEAAPEVVQGVRAKPEPKVPEAALTEDALGALRRDQDAVVKAGSFEEAINDGHRFKGRDVIPWQKFTAPEQAREFIEQAARDNIDYINKVRGGNADGVLTDKVLDSMVNQRVRLTGEDPDLIRGMLRSAGDNARSMAANMETSFLISNRAFMDVFELARRIEAGNFEGFGSKAIADAALKERLGTALEMLAQSKAMLAAAGRTMRRARGDFAVRAEQLQKVNIMGSGMGATDADALRMAILSTDGDTAGIAKLGAPSFVKMLTDWSGGALAANLLWGWSTQVINLAMNVASSQWRAAEKYLGGAVKGAKAAATGDVAGAASARVIRTQAKREAVAFASQVADGWNGAVYAFTRGDSRLAPHAIENLTDATGSNRLGTGPLTNVWQPIDMSTPSAMVSSLTRNALMAANIGIHGSLRAMGAVDEAIMTMRYRALVIAKATTDADELGLKAGSAQYREFVEKRVSEAFDSEGRALDADALMEAKTTNFQNELIGSGTDDTWGNFASFGALWQQGVSQNAMLRVVTPFVKTPTNIFRYGVKLTPGLNLLQKEYLNAIRGVKGDEAQARAIGQMMLGTLLVAYGANLRLNGTITGSGPTDPKMAQSWRAEGNTPYSIVFRDGNKKTFLQINRLDPYQAPIALIADATDLLMQGHLSAEQENSVGAAVLLAIQHQIKDKTYLKNLADFLGAASDENRMKSLPKRIIPGFIPMSSLFRSAAQLTDPYVHEAFSTLDAIKATLPGFSSTVPKRYSPLGEPVKVPGRFVNEQQHSGPLADALDTSYRATGNFIQPVSPRVGNEGVDLRELTTESGKNAFERYNELIGKPHTSMPKLAEALTKLVGTSAYQMAPHGRPSENSTKEWMLGSAVSEYRNAALEALKRESPAVMAALSKRKQEVYNAAQAGKKDARVEGARAGVDNLNNLLSAYGVAMPKPNSVPQP